jgi:hypothetical protein
MNTPSTAAQPKCPTCGSTNFIDLGQVEVPRPQIAYVVPEGVRVPVTDFHWLRCENRHRFEWNMGH